MSEGSDFLSFMGSLDDTLLRVLVQSSTNSMLSEQPHEISVGNFFCEMYRRFPDQISVFFENPERFKSIADKLAPRSLPIDLLSDRKALAERMTLRREALQKATIVGDWSLPDKEGGTPALDVRLSSSLGGLFRRTAALAIEAEHHRADMHDLVKALSMDEALAGELREETGLILKK